jgi:hypothetical protein
MSCSKIVMSFSLMFVNVSFKLRPTPRNIMMLTTARWSLRLAIGFGYVSFIGRPSLWWLVRTGSYGLGSQGLSVCWNGLVRWPIVWSCPKELGFMMCFTLESSSRSEAILHRRLRRFYRQCVMGGCCWSLAVLCVPNSGVASGMFSSSG